MNKKYVKDMTEGNELSLLLSFSLPMLMGNLFQQVYNMVDSIVVGKYVGKNALAAVGATGSLNFLFFSLCIGLTGGIGIVISQYFGAGDEKNVKKTIYNSIGMLFISAAFMSLLGIFLSRPILTWLRTPDEILDEAVIYMQITSAGILGVAAYNGISSILRALGDSKTPLIFLIFASVINVILDLILVIEFGLGVRGVAVATILSQLFSAIGSLLYTIRRNPYLKITREEMVFDIDITGKCYKLGLPLAIQSSLIAVSCVALQSVVNTFGAIVVAAFTATSRIEQLVQQPYNSLGLAVSTFTGQNMGAGKLDRVKSAYKKSMLLVAAFSLVMLVVFHLFGNLIMRAFVDDAEVIRYGTSALKITSWFYLGLGAIYVVRGLLNGAGDSTYSMINGAVEVLGRIIFANTLIMLPFIAEWGVWYATALTWTVTGVFSLLRYKQGKWMSIKLVENVTEKEKTAKRLKKASLI